LHCTTRIEARMPRAGVGFWGGATVPSPPARSMWGCCKLPQWGLGPPLLVSYFPCAYIMILFIPVDDCGLHVFGVLLTSLCIGVKCVTRSLVIW